MAMRLTAFSVDSDEVALLRAVDRCGRDRQFAAEALLVDRNEATAIARPAKNAEHAVLRAVEHLDRVAAVVGTVAVGRFLDPHQRFVTDAGHFRGTRAARHVEADFRRLAVLLAIPFGGNGNQLAVGIAAGDVGEDDARERAGVVELLAALFDAAFVGEVAQHGFQRGAICVLEPEGSGDLAGADVAGFLADEGKHVFFAGKGVLMWL
jgi:hypothetical protein